MSHESEAHLFFYQRRVRFEKKFGNARQIRLLSRPISRRALRKEEGRVSNAQVPGNAEETLLRLMDCYGGMLTNLCAMTLGDTSLAQDAVQETFLKAYRSLSQLETVRSERAWLIRVAVNTCRDIQRSAWMCHMDRRVSLDQLPEAASPVSPSDSGVLDAVRSLPVKERQVILMRYWQNLSVEETAEALGLNRATVYRRLAKAQKRLKDLVEGWENDD